MKRALSYLVTSAYGLISFFVLYLISAIKGSESDEWGNSIAYGNKSYLVICIIFFIFTIYGIYALTKCLKKEKEDKSFLSLLTSTSLFIGFAYLLGLTINNGLKGEDVHLIAILSVLLLLLFLSSLLPLVGIFKEKFSQSAKK